MARYSIRCTVVRSTVSRVGRIDRRGVTSVTVDVYDMRTHPAGHGYGCKDRDQSRDWCAFAVNGISLDQTVPARGEEPVLESGTGSRRQPTIRLERRSPYTENDCRHRHRVCAGRVPRASSPSELGENLKLVLRCSWCTRRSGGCRCDCALSETSKMRNGVSSRRIAKDVGGQFAVALCRPKRGPRQLLSYTGNTERSMGIAEIGVGGSARNQSGPQRAIDFESKAQVERESSHEG